MIADICHGCRYYCTALASAHVCARDHYRQLQATALAVIISLLVASPCVRGDLRPLYWVINAMVFVHMHQPLPKATAHMCAGYDHHHYHHCC